MFSHTFFEKNQKAATVIGVSIIIFIGVYVLIHSNKLNKLNDRGKYTIGTVKKLVDSKDAFDPIYEFEVKGIKYTSKEARIIQGVHNFNSEDIGSRFFVLYDSIEPSNSCLLPKSPVPKNIDTAPFNGWDSIPNIRQ